MSLLADAVTWNPHSLCVDNCAVGLADTGLLRVLSEMLGSTVPPDAAAAAGVALQCSTLQVLQPLAAALSSSNRSSGRSHLIVRGPAIISAAGSMLNSVNALQEPAASLLVTLGLADSKLRTLVCQQKGVVMQLVGMLGRLTDTHLRGQVLQLLAAASEDRAVAVQIRAAGGVPFVSPLARSWRPATRRAAKRVLQHITVRVTC